ncbi:DsbC/DsbD-like thiol-disulfide interchange protein [Roseimicrobium gellanilyticum]|uniref:DsbC/DsbD-like thiol-disulfide interchange protein n=1 Tax=Roseimicrobium gellanilyticum TaxID=748857 RepID=A0A366HRC7_9BACT|nr:protein-disulfide reductase DsbD domain-containing protein [Roseimicrobium gellanilyticum]RBP46220.1 DsbC/DsbD-like thiol-disulfide interchange protein [Roseimicrobium gellanilyticum]
MPISKMSSNKGHGTREKGRGSLVQLLLAIFAGLVLQQNAHALEPNSPLQIALVSEVKAVQPGKAFYAGLHLKHKEGYHTYWKFPGIVGVPISLDWSLPDGWKAGGLEWPEPEQVHMFQIRAQGYHGDLVIPVRITPPADLKPGTKVTLAGKAAWMCCGRDCNPDFADLTLELPVTETAELDAKWEPAFVKAREAAPQALDEKAWAITATRKDKNLVTLHVTAKSDAAKQQLASVKEVLFFTDDGYIHVDKDQILRRDGDGKLSLELTVSEYYDGKSPPAQLLGLLQTPQGWGKGFTSKTVIIKAPIE